MEISEKTKYIWSVIYVINLGFSFKLLKMRYFFLLILEKLHVRKSFLNQTTYVLKFWLVWRTDFQFLKLRFFLNLQFLNCRLICKWNGETIQIFELLKLLVWLVSPNTYQKNWFNEFYTSILKGDSMNLRLMSEVLGPLRLSFRILCIKYAKK